MIQVIFPRAFLVRVSVSEERLRFFFCGLLLGCFSLGFSRTYLTPQKALHLIYGKEAKFQKKLLKLTQKQRKELSQRARAKFFEKKIVYYEASNKQPLGCAYLMNEIGKFKFITFLVGLDEKGKVKRVLVLVYREPRGSAVKENRFLRQYRGKGTKDPIRPHRDILNIAGATLSVRAISRGVRKALSLAPLSCTQTKENPLP